MKGFTLIETLLSLALFALLAGAIYSVSSAALDASAATLENQAEQERLDAFLRATRQAFLSIPPDGSVELRYDTAGAAGTAEIVFRGSGTYYGIPSLAGGELILSPRPQSDGSRTFSLLRIPKNTASAELARLREGAGWLPIYPYAEKVEWQFSDGQEWTSEWPSGVRPKLIRLEFSETGNPSGPVSAYFQVPDVSIPTAQEEQDEERNTERESEQ